jgi:hypothetical protein
MVFCGKKTWNCMCDHMAQHPSTPRFTCKHMHKSVPLNTCRIWSKADYNQPSTSHANELIHRMDPSSFSMFSRRTNM